ncbi:MAG: hypothetical protein AAGF91_14830, partial [Actinomycetota bacterium]
HDVRCQVGELLGVRGEVHLGLGRDGERTPGTFHVALNDLALLQVCQALVHGRPARFENATAQSPEAMQTWLSTSADHDHTMRRATSAAVQLRAALARLSPEQLDTTVPCLLTHDGEVVLDGERPWGALAITTQTEMHLPAHTEQLADLTADVVSTHS